MTKTDHFVCFELGVDFGGAINEIIPLDPTTLIPLEDAQGKVYGYQEKVDGKYGRVLKLYQVIMLPVFAR